jgi:hypothetical protein
MNQAIQTAVQGEDIIVTQPAAKPPEPGGKGAVILVVTNDSCFGVDAPMLKRVGQSFFFRKGMPAIITRGGGKMLIQIGMLRSGYVSSVEILFTLCQVAQVEPAV